MNLVLFWYSELQMDVDSKGRKGWFVEIPPGDDRFTHIFEVLNLSGHVDQVAKVGLVNGNTGLAEMEWVTYPRNDLLRAKLDNGDVQYPVYCHVTSANHATTPKGSEEEAGEDDIDQKTLLANRGRGREDDEDSFLPYIVEGPTKMVCKRVGPHYGRKEPGFNLDGFIAAKASRSKRDDDNGGQPAPKKQRGNGTDYRGDKRLEYFIRSLKVKFRFIPERLYGDHEMPLTRKTFFLRGLQKLDPNAEPPTPQPIRSPLAIGEEAAASYMVPPAFTLGAMSDVNMQLAAEITNMPSNGVTSPPNSPSKIDPLVNMSSMSPMVGFDHAGSFASQMALAHQAGLVRAGSKVTVQVPMSPLFQQTNIGRPRKEGVNYIYYKGRTSTMRARVTVCFTTMMVSRRLFCPKTMARTSFSRPRPRPPPAQPVNRKRGRALPKSEEPNQKQGECSLALPVAWIH
ncbi:unnamed protein product [Amoebophrya sp. A25]|nr:unnamed protein product [Amoebophrya sp. A25]|eukprot:GSA25T00006466001.1